MVETPLALLIQFSRLGIPGLLNGAIEFSKLRPYFLPVERCVGRERPLSDIGRHPSRRRIEFEATHLVDRRGSECAYRQQRGGNYSVTRIADFNDPAQLLLDKPFTRSPALSRRKVS